MKIIMKNNTVTGFQGYDFFTERPVTLSGNDKIRFVTDPGGFPVSSEQAYKRGFEIDEAFEYPLFRTREDVTRFLRQVLLLKNSDPKYGELYQQLGQGLDVYSQKKPVQPGSRQGLIDRGLLPDGKPKPALDKIIDIRYYDDGSVQKKIRLNADGTTTEFSYPSGAAGSGSGSGVMFDPTKEQLIGQGL